MLRLLNYKQWSFFNYAILSKFFGGEKIASILVKYVYSLE